MVSWIWSLFCKHEWQYKKTVRVWWDQTNRILDKEYDIYVCPKCLKTKRVYFYG